MAHFIARNHSVTDWDIAFSLNALHGNGELSHVDVVNQDISRLQPYGQSQQPVLRGPKTSISDKALENKICTNGSNQRATVAMVHHISRAQADKARNEEVFINVCTLKHLGELQILANL